MGDISFLGQKESACMALEQLHPVPVDVVRSEMMNVHGYRQPLSRRQEDGIGIPPTRTNASTCNTLGWSRYEMWSIYGSILSCSFQATFNGTSPLQKNCALGMVRTLIAHRMPRGLQTISQKN
jgi:hypothetical protein